MILQEICYCQNSYKQTMDIHAPFMFILSNSLKNKIVTHLHKTSHKSRFLHVEFKNPFCRAQSVLQFGENQKSILFFYPKLWNFENRENIKS